MNRSKELFDYWHPRVRVTNLKLVSNLNHVETFDLRHNCTNYDQLWKSPRVQRLDEPERSQNIAIIKYLCTSKVLQERTRILRNRIENLQKTTQELTQKRSQFEKLILQLKKIIFGKEQEMKALKHRISIIEAENEELKVQAESDKAYAELQQEFKNLKKEFDKVAKRRQELAKNNQSLGGRVAHTQRYRRERDEAQAAVQDLQQQLTLAKTENQHLQQENETLGLELKQLRQQTKLGIVEIRRDGH